MAVEFDEATARRLEKMYQTRAMVERRHIVRQALSAADGEHVIDIGCGPGLYAFDLLADVGPAGGVVGIDTSDDMLVLARRRCQEHPNAQFHVGDAAVLRAASEAFDAALSVQVLEYVPDVAASLAEIFRVLKPSGRAVIWDTDWSTVSWHSSDPARMQRVLRAWDEHARHPSLPRVLAPALRGTGFEHVSFTAHCMATDDPGPDTHGGTALRLIPPYVAGQGLVASDELGAWEAEQQELAARGEFFFCVTQFCFTARRPER